MISSKPRRCRLEALEQRTLLSVSGAGSEELSVSWSPRVDVAWFGPLNSTSVAVAPSADALPKGHPTFSQAASPGEPDAEAANRWVVQLTPDAASKAGSVTGAVRFLDADSLNAQIVRGLGLEGMVLVAGDSGADPTAVSAWLDANPNVAYYEPDSIVRTHLMPNDGSFASLWGMHNTGQTGGTVDADIDAPEAWDLVTGAESIVVGVIDSGIDYNHPDLAANVWTNPGEVPGNGLDDDGNGYVDDVHGYDFANNDGDPFDDEGHGTHVSGTIAGVGNNGQGVAGVNWTASLMGLKFLDAEGSGFTSDAVEAVNYATMMRSLYGIDLRVTNNSWGGGGFSQALYDAIEAGGEEGILFVAAAGNDSTDTDADPHYPSSYDLSCVLSVAATNHNDNLASFSNYGATSVDLAAPGASIYSTLPGSSYGTYSGTSMATPHVAGAAALAWAGAPNSTMLQVRDALLAGVDPVASLSGVVATGGRLNAYNTLEGLSINVLSSDPAAESIISTPPLEFTVRFTHAYDPLSIDAADLTVNGALPDRVAVVDDSAVVFEFDATPVITEGPQLMEIAAGSILRAADGDPINAWQATFYYDLVGLAVVSTVPSEAEVLAAPPVEIILDFNEAIDPLSVDASDLSLNVGAVASAAMLDADSVAYTVGGLPREGAVTYTLREGALRDAQGSPGSAYTGHFTIDDPLIERYASGDVPKSITDYTTITSTLLVNESFAIADLDVELEITHTYDADLDVSLIGPDGTRVLLFSSVGGGGNDFSGTVLDDEADTAIADGQAPFLGRYRPAEPLSAFDTLNVTGTWTLEVGDQSGWDQGALNGWALIVERGPELPPRIRSVSPLPPDGEIAWEPISTLDVRFSEEMDPASVNNTAHWELLEAGPDGLFDTADDVDYPLNLSSPYAGGTTVVLETGVANLPVGDYRFRAIAGGLTDLSGAPLDGNADTIGGDDYLRHFNVSASYSYSSDDVPLNIIDGLTTTSTLTIDEPYLIHDLDVVLDITHTYDADLHVHLVAPDGTRVELFTGVGEGGNNFTGTVLDDEALVSIAHGTAPFDGRYRPEGLLSVLDGSSIQGTWTLEILDDALLDIGTLNSWSLVVTSEAAAPPQISFIDPLSAGGGVLWGPLGSLEVHFSEEMDPATVNGGPWELLQAGADGLFDTGDDVHYGLTLDPPYVDGLVATLQVDAGYLPAGSYRFTAASGGLTDLFGTPLDGNADGVAGDDYSTQFTLLASNRYPAADVPMAILDSDTITSTVTVDDALTIADLDVQIDITHTYDDDLDVYLIAPDGTRVELFTAVGGSGDNFVGTILDDEAPTAITEGTAPFNDRYRPEGLLSVLDGSSVQGTWTLEVTDAAAFDSGTLNGWALIVHPNASVPPHIVEHQPAGVSLGPVDSLRLDFDRPMNELSFALADDVLSFTGPQGAVVPTGFSWHDPQSLDITFAPQTAGGAYTLVLGPQIVSTAGVALDQDGDSLPGEMPDDRYLADFVIAHPLGSLRFVELPGQDPSAGDLWYYFQTTRLGTLTLQASFHGGAGDVALTLYDGDLNDLSTTVFTPAYLNRRIDREVLSGETYYLKLSGTNADVNLRLANLLNHQGPTVTVYGSGADDQYEFEAAATHHVTVNGIGYEFDPADAASVVFRGGGGNDAATLRSSAGDDTVELWPGQGTLTGDGYNVAINDVEAVTVDGGGGADLAFLHDNPLAKDTLTGGPDVVTLVGNPYSNQVANFRYVHVSGTPGYGDEALLQGDPNGQDTFEAGPGEAKLSGNAYFLRAKSFDAVRADGTPGGDDVALLNDDPAGIDTFVGGPDQATLSGGAFSVEANSFRYVHTYFTAGSGDVATLHDDPARFDRLRAWPSEAKLFGEQFFLRVKSCDSVYANSTPGGGDLAQLYDSITDDTFTAWPTRAELAGDTFFVQVNSYRWVHGYSTTGNDVATFYGSVDRDVFVGNDRFGKLRGTDFYNRAVSFGQLHVYGRGSRDVAVLHDAVLETGVTQPIGMTQVAWLYEFERIRERSGGGDTITDVTDQIFTAYWP